MFPSALIIFRKCDFKQAGMKHRFIAKYSKF